MIIAPPRSRRASSPRSRSSRTQTLRTEALVVGGDPTRSRRCRRDSELRGARKFGIHSAMSCAGGPAALPRRPSLSALVTALLPRILARVWETVRGVVPTVERTRARRASPRYRQECTADSSSRRARSPERSRPPFGQRHEPHLRTVGVSTSKVVGEDQRATIAGSRRGSPSFRRPRRRSFPRAVRRRRRLRGVGPKAERAPRSPPASRRSARLPRSARRAPPRAFAGSVSGAMLHEAAPAAIDPRGLDQQTQRISISVENTFERDLTDRTQLRAELRWMADANSRSTFADTGKDEAFTVIDEAALHRLLHPHVGRASLRVGIRRQPSKIRGARMTALLDRALARPPRCASARRGSASAGLASHRQLALV